MTKKDFIVLYNTATEVSLRAYNRLGLICKRFTKAYATEFETLQDEEFYLRAASGKIVDMVLQKEQSGQIIIDASKEVALLKELKEWKNEPMAFDSSKFAPVEIIDKKLLMIAPAIFETLNGFVISCDEDVYLEALSASEKE